MTTHPSRRSIFVRSPTIRIWAKALGLLLLFSVVLRQVESSVEAQQKEARDQAAASKKSEVAASASAASESRHAPPKNLDGYFPFKPYTSRADWDARAEQLRRQLLVATGLWPMPERTPPRAIVHGKIDRDEYTVEKVILESWPGHYVTGNLYRPKGKSGKLAAVLCPHGHWNNGRFYDAGDAGVKKQIEQGAEKYDPSGRYPLQARCVQLARMGCVVFHYDMLGYADSVQIPHSIAHGFRERRANMEGKAEWGFFSPQAELHLQSILGLQTYNSLRALDWVSELPDVDASRIGVTGASGGGTQTFVLCAIDPRPAVAFPAVMVSTAMQGGCTCENCSYLRIGTGNIEISALIAPRPLGMTAADDWTKEMETKGFPELKEHFKLLGVPENVMLAALLKFDHNYNYPSRTAMYEWMNKHLRLGQKTPIVEQDFRPLSREELTVWNDEHPRPSGDSVGDAYERKLLKQMTDDARQQLAALRPDKKRREWLREFERVVGGGWDVLIGRRLPKPASVQYNIQQREQKGAYDIERVLIQNTTEGEQVQAVFLAPKEAKNRTVIWLDERGKQGLFASSGEPMAAIQKLLDAGLTVVGVDLLYQGETPAGEAAQKHASIKHPRNYAGFTYGYNYPLFAKRVHDVLSTIAAVRDLQPSEREIYLVGFGPAGAWAAAATAQSGNEIFGLAADLRSFRFADLKQIDDANLLPGAVKYGDVDALLALAQPKYRLHFGADSWRDFVQAAAAYRGTPYATALLDSEGDEGKLSTARWIIESPIVRKGDSK
jgi:dienelactone hydrolase